MSVSESRNPASVKNMVLMENLSSEEHYLYEDGTSRRVLEDISFSVNRGEVWGVSGRHAFDVRLLLEIMANIRPYGDGKCVLTERGMMRHKRKILPHVFYIGGSGMAYDNMNTLEYLMFATACKWRDPVRQQDRLFELLIGGGLGYLSLTRIGQLSESEKSVVILVAALLSDSLLIVFNRPEVLYDGLLTGALTSIAAAFRKRGKALVIGTNDPLLVDRACSHSAYVHKGRLLFHGTVEELQSRDPVELILRDCDPARLLERLSPLLPGYKLTLKENCLLIGCGDTPCDKLRISKTILAAGILPESIEQNRKNAENAYEELLRLHDLQESLF